MTIQEQIVEANKAYRIGRPIMTDQAFDDLCEAYEKTVSPEEYAAFRDSLHEETGKVSHPFIMGSLDKMKAEEPDKLLAWIAARVLPVAPALSVSAKIDGISCRLHYEKGRMASATTRGDGHAGVDITDKVKLVGHGVPATVPNRKGPLDIRGELVIKDADFAHIADQFANPRNACAGIMNQKTAEPDILRHISFVSYEIMGGERTKRDQFSSLASLGFDVAWNTEIGLDPVPADIVGQLTELAGRDFGYPTDGLVLSSPLYKAENRYRPQAQVAFKLNQLVAQSRIAGIEWGEPSKDGRMCPVAVIEPVEIGGSTITRVTLHNADWIRQMGLGIGSVVEIVKSGDVIPKLTRVLAGGKATPVKVPEKCPSCGTPLVRDGCDIRCPNGDCPSRGYERVLAFITNIGIKRVSRKTLEAWGVGSFDKLLAFRANPDYKMEVYFEKEISRCVMGASAIDLFKALPFRDLADITLTKIIGHYGYRNLKDGRIDADDFPEGVGQKTMDAFRACAAANFAIVERIVCDPRYHGAAAEDGEWETRPVGQKGSVCFTGALDTMSRAEASKRAAAAGYEVKSSVAKGLTYLVTNDPESGSSKNMKARQLGIKIITEKEFLALLGAGEIRLDPELSPGWPDHFTVADVDELVAHIRSEELEDNGNIGFRGRPQDLATIGWPLIDGRVYRLSVHGHEAGDWEIPHLHLDRADDLERRSFSFEISLVALLATGEPALLRQKDLYAGFAGIARTGTECGWTGYERLRDGLLAYLEAGPEGAAPRCSRSNLESAIIAWNKERGPDPHALADYLREHGVSVLDKYGKYFPSLPRPPRSDSPAS